MGLESLIEVPGTRAAVWGDGAYPSEEHTALLQRRGIRNHLHERPWREPTLTRTPKRGTFIISARGALLAGDATALTRLRQEIINADPDFFSAMDAIPSSFWSQYLTTSSSSITSSTISPNFSFDRALRCGAFLSGDAALVLAFVDPATTLFSLDFTSVYGTAMFINTATQCF